MIVLSQKYTVEHSEETITFSVPFGKLWTDVVAVGVEILVASAFIVYAIINISAPASDTSVPIPFIPFLILILVLFVIELLWLLYGVEILEVNKTHIFIRHRIFGVGLSKRFRFDKVEGVFVSRNKIGDQFFFQLTKGYMPTDFKKGMIVVYCGKTIFGRTKIFRFGTNLNEVEAQEIVNLIHGKFQQYKYSPVKKTG